MKSILLVLFLIATTFILGYGAVNLYNSISGAIRKTSPEREALFGRMTSYFSSGTLILLSISGGTTVVSHFLTLTLSYAKRVFAFSLIFVLTICFAVMITVRFMRILKKSKDISNAGSVQSSQEMPSESAQKAVHKANTLTVVLLILTCLLIACEFIYTASAVSINFTTDQMAESINNFIRNDRFYVENPLTGLPYTHYYPSRLPFLCLPMFYTVLASSFKINTTTLLWHVMPAFWLFAGFCSMYRVAYSIFPDVRVMSGDAKSDKAKSDKTALSGGKADALNKRFAFMLISAFCLICTNIGPGLPGYDALHRGYMPGNVLCLIIIPLCLSYVLRKKWFAAIFTIFVELFVAQTQFAIGVCTVMTIFFFVSAQIQKKRSNVKKSEKNLSAAEKGGADGND